MSTTYIYSVTISEQCPAREHGTIRVKAADVHEAARKAVTRAFGRGVGFNGPAGYTCRADEVRVGSVATGEGHDPRRFVEYHAHGGCWRRCQQNASSRVGGRVSIRVEEV